MTAEEDKGRVHDETQQPPGQLAGKTAHDLNNLFGIVVVNLDLLDSAIKGDPEQKELIDAAREAALRGSDLIERLQAGSSDPVSEPKPINPATPPQPEAGGGSAPGPGRILVVDDNDAMRRAAAATLKSLGYAPSEAVSGDAALAMLESGERFDLIFTDIMMPGNLTGLDLARVVRERGWPSKLVFTTGFASPADLSAEIQKSGGTVLQKPYRKTALEQAIRTALGDKAPSKATL